MNSPEHPHRKPSPHLKAARVSNRFAHPQPPPRAPGLLTVPGQNDRYLGDLGFNRQHRFALPVYCILVLLSPLLVLWAGYASLMRWRGRRHARRCNAAFVSRPITRSRHE